MVGASKILTVSYGTFSCTLEGFDEPFSTMKAIAEYFRDLAADDRYFGAEPPQPDAEMLHRIAEREMARRVEARIQKNGVILRPGGTAEGGDTAAPAPPMPIAPLAAPQPATPPGTPGPAPLRADPVADPIISSVAAKLQRIRAAVAQARSATETEPEPDDLPPGLADSEPDLPVDQRISVPEDFGFALDISGPLSAEENASLSEAEAEEETADDDADDTAQAGAEADAQAARQRRRAERRAARLAEMAETQTPEGEDDDRLPDAEAHAVTEAEADTAPEGETDAAPEVAEVAQPDAVAETIAEGETDAPPEAVAETTPPETEPETEPEMEPEAVPDAAADAAPAEAATEPPRPAIRARVIKLRRSEPLPAAAPASDAGTETVPAETDAVLAALAAQLAPATAETPDATDTEPRLSPEAEAELMAELAALGADLPDEDWGRLPAETGTGSEIETAFAKDVAAEVAAAQEPADLPPERPAPAAAAEAQAEAETPTDETDDLEPPAPAAPPEPLVLTNARPAAPTPLPDGDVSRLLDKADAQMAGQENRRRFSAIAHLKAAVAATVAERRSGAGPAQPDDTAPYRQDLTQAVRPRRPVLPPSPTDGANAPPPEVRPATARPELRQAPLVLVSEQRVDRQPAEEAAKTQAVRPRRVTATLLREQVTESETQDAVDEAPEAAPLSPEAATSFAEFAQSRAPQGLAELLEAAAAYTAQVEGRPHFSPPQIMRKVTSMGTETFSREDRLRVFGTLLRQGKIAKVKRGQYAITEASRFYERSA